MKKKTKNTNASPTHYNSTDNDWVKNFRGPILFILCSKLLLGHAMERAGDQGKEGK